MIEIMFKYTQTFLLLLFYFLSLPASSNSNTIVTIAPLSDNDTRYLYANELLDLILEKTQDEYGLDAIEYYPEAVSRQRSLMLIKEGKIDVIAEATQKKWESTLIPIRIPIRKGIQGYRLFMTNKNYSQSLANIKTLQDLRELKTGAGSQWVISGILEENNFNVVTSGNYESLFKMLNADRFSTFSRGVNEIFPEFLSHSEANPNILIDQFLALYTPLPTFFFVSPKNQMLAQRIQKGLEIMIETGEFDEFFYRHHNDILEKSTLTKRRIFILNNPNLSEETRKIITNKTYWHFPGDRI